MQGPVSTGVVRPIAVRRGSSTSVGGDRVADVLVAGRRGEHDPGDPTVGQHERPARVARPDQRLQLEHETLDLAVPVDVSPDRVDRPPDGGAADVERAALRVPEDGARVRRGRASR